MRFKTTYVLFAILGVMMVVFNVALLLTPAYPRDETLVFPSTREPGKEIRPEDVARVTIQHNALPAEALSFVRKNGEWDLEPAGTYRITSERVDVLVKQVLFARRKQAELGDDLAGFGLVNPKTVIKLEAKGKELILLVGSQNEENLYLLSSDYDDEPLVADASAFTMLNSRRDDFRNSNLLAQTASQIQFVDVRSKDGKAVLSFAKNQWKLEEPNYGLAQEDPLEGASGDAPTGVNEVISQLIGLNVLSTGGFDANNADVPYQKSKSVHSEEQAFLVVRVKAKPSDKQAVTLLIGSEIPGTGSDKEPPDRFARLSNYPHVYRVPGGPVRSLAAFAKSPEQLRDHTLARVAGAVDAVQIRLEGQEKPMELIRTQTRIPGAPQPVFTWKLYLGDQLARTVDSTEVEDNLLRRLRDVKGIRKFPKPGTREAELGKPEVTVQLWANGVDPTSGKGQKPKIAGEPAVKLTFGRQDLEDSTALVERTQGEVRVIAKVPLQFFVMARRKPIDYLAKAIPGYAADEKSVRKLVVVHPKDGRIAMKCTQRALGQEWLFQQPDYLMARPVNEANVRLILRELNRIKVKDWLKLAVSKDGLADLGLDNPTMRFAVTVSSNKQLGNLFEELHLPQWWRDLVVQEKEVQLLVGKSTKDGDSYALMGERGDVFVLDGVKVRTTLSNTSQRQSLVDLRLFPSLQFLRNQVRGLKLTGWRDLPNPPPTYYLHRLDRGRTWKVTGPTPDADKLKANAPRLEKLLSSLVEGKARTIHSYKIGPEDDQRLKPEQGALEIEVLFQDSAKQNPLKLTLGKLEDGDYYAIQHQYPKDVLRIPKEVFFERNDGAQSFAKPDYFVTKR